MNFTIALEEIEKHAGLMDAVKGLALTEIPGTKPWLINAAKKPASDSLKNTGKLIAGARGPVSGMRRAVTRSASSGPGSQRVYDVSDMARKMGL